MPGSHVKPTDPERLNCQPTEWISFEELAVLRVLTQDEEGWFWDAITSVDHVLLHPGCVKMCTHHDMAFT